MRRQRGTMVWLSMMGGIIGLTAILELVTAPLLSVILVGGYGLLLAALFATDRLRALQQAIPKAIPNLTVAARATPAAREAVARARRLASASTPEIVTDVGMIVNERTSGGQLRPKAITSVISLSEQGTQPFVKLNVPPQRSHRTALIKFDIIDREGKTQFSREVQQFVQDGENLITCDRQLPLRDNDRLGRAGAWELQVTVNGTLAACYTFTTTPAGTRSASSASGFGASTGTGSASASAPSISARRSRLADDGEAAPAPASGSAEEEDEAPARPLSLDELLRDQRGGKS